MGGGRLCRALFSTLYMRTLASARRQKAAKVRSDFRMKDALLIKLSAEPRLERVRGERRGLAAEHTDTHTH